MLRRTATAIAARLLIAVLLLGVPTVLIALVGYPLPTQAQWVEILRLEPDWANAVLLGKVLPCAAWIAWVAFAYPLAAELLRHWVGRPLLPSVRALRGQHRVAAVLVTAALLTSGQALASSGNATATQAARAAVARMIDGQPELTAAHSRPLAPTEEPGATRHSASTARATTYRVRTGDTLWDIAARRLGSGTDYPEIVKASDHLRQPDGGRLTDPDLILPGWHLTIPTKKSTQPHSSPSVTPTEHSPQSTNSAIPTLTPATHQPAEASTASKSLDGNPSGSHSSTATDELVSVRVGGGVAALLAAGIIAALTRRRRTQRARRQFGERVPMPDSGPTRELEEQLRAVSDPDALASLHAALAHVLDTARRTSTPLPQLFAVRVDADQITLYLCQPAVLEAPFQPLFTDSTAWTVPRDTFTTPADPTAASPYPALVTVGTDLDDGILLFDLEQQVNLAVTGDAAAVRGVINALTAELASVPWGEDIHLSLVGVPEHLASELDPYRIHHVADVRTVARDIRTHLQDRQTVLDEAALSDVRTARIGAADIESWAPFVVIIGTEPNPDERAELEALAQRYSAAGLVLVQASLSSASAAEINLTPTAAAYRSSSTRLSPLPFIPQLLDDRALETALEVFRISTAPGQSADASPSPTNSPHLARGDERPELVRTRTVNDAAETEASSEERPSASSPATLPQAGTHPLGPSGSILIQEVQPNAPYVHLFGRVEALRVTRPDLMPGRGVEFLAYLLHHPQPVSGAQIQKALWPTSYDRTNGNARTLAKQVRAALGHDRDGHLWLPEGRGATGFTLHPEVHSDWNEFTILVGSHPSEVSTAQLAKALQLVRGQPLLGTDGHRGRWTWRSILEENVIAAIHDVAALAADFAVAEGDSALAKLAVRAARFADPLGELSWQIELRLATQRRSTAEVERIVADLYATAGRGDPDFNPDPVTISLIRSARLASASGPG